MLCFTPAAALWEHACQHSAKERSGRLPATHRAVATSVSVDSTACATPHLCALFHVRGILLNCSDADVYGFFPNLCCHICVFD
jgi:hypothetical protein